MMPLCKCGAAEFARISAKNESMRKFPAKSARFSPETAQLTLDFCRRIR